MYLTFFSLRDEIGNATLREAILLRFW